MRRRVLLATMVATFLATGAFAADIQCCLEACGNPVWNSCASGATCTGGFCAPPLGSAIAATTDPCGTGSASSCPATEAGQCADGVNNDVWTGDSETDCADPDCAGDPACPASAPVVGPAALAALVLALAIGGTAILRRRTHG